MDPWQQAFQFFRDRGYSDAAAAGIAGGLRGETANLDPTQSHDNGIGLGIAGWNGPRLSALQEFAQSRGMDPRSTPAQLAFVDNELHGSEASVGGRLRGVTDPGEAGNIMLAYFRPKDWNVPGAHPERADYARRFYTQFTDQPATTAGSASPPIASSVGPQNPNTGDIATAFTGEFTPPTLTLRSSRSPMRRGAVAESFVDPAFEPRGARRLQPQNPTIRSV